MFQFLRRPAKWALALAVCPLAADALTVTGSYFQYDELFTNGGDRKFGISVAINGDGAVVNAPQPASGSEGIVTVYRMYDSRWVSEGEFTSIQPANDFGAYLGCNPVVIEGDVAAFGEPSANSYRGVVLVFRRTTMGWLHEATLSDDAGAIYDSFGCALAISNGKILVGAPHKNSTGQGYIFSYNSARWTLEAQLVPMGATSGDAVGLSGAINGNEVVLGAPHASGDRGSAFVFSKVGDKWSQIEMISGSDTAPEDQFGASVGISQGTVVVGAPEHAAGDGAAYIFSGPSLIQQQKLSLLGTSYYGASVAIDGGRLAVSRLGNDAVDMFFRHGTVWSKSAVINGSAYTRFGGSVAISGPTVLIGASGDSGGRAYLLKDDWIFRDQFQ